MTNKQETQDNKDKVRVYEYAKKLNMSSKEIITILKRVNLPVNNHMSVMEDNMVHAVEKFFRDVKANAAAKMAQSKPAGGGARPDAPAGGRKAEDGAAVKAAPKPPQAEQPQPAQSGQSERPQAEGDRAGGRQGERAHDQGGRGDRPQGQGQGGNRFGDRPQGQGQGGNRFGDRPQGQGQGGNRFGDRPQGQGQGGGNRPQGQGQGGNRFGDRPQGQGQGGGNRFGDRPQGQGGNRPQGQGGGNRPQGQGGGNRPQGQGGGRPQGAGGGFGARIPAPPAAAAAPAGSRGGARPGGGKGREDFNRNGGAGGKRKENDFGKRFDDGRMNFKSRGKGGKNGKNRNNQPPREKIDNTPKKIIVRGEMTVGELAKLLHKDASEVIKKLLFLGVMATINQDLDLDTVLLVASEFGVETEVKIVVEDTNFETIEENDDPDDLLERPPVVTIMGHVDHGKTTLLDAIRETKVASGEAGGITQHIGAYQVEVNGKKITFLDTPGHEAFTTMRARGAQVTDITILVVAADDGVMPQTVEAINHAKAANVPIIVAVNKIDKPGANPDKVKTELTEYGLVQEEWGGDTIFVEVSAKQRLNLDNLLEMILLVAEVNDYKANPDKRARGTVLEAELDKGKGPIARILVQNGTLKVGDAFVAGDRFGRIRAMTNDRGRRVKEAGPSTPVEITGLTEVPQAGDPFMVFEDERKAREIAEKRSIKTRQETLKSNSKVTLDDLFNKIKEGEIKDLNVILKADVQGSLEALKGSLEKIEIEGVRVKAIHTGVGAITESDITLALASSAIVVGFNVRPEPRAAAFAEQEKVDVRLHRIIYKVIEEIEQAMKGMLDPVFKEKVIGHAEVRETFKVSKVGTIAGCMVTDGKVTRTAEARLVRGGIVVYEGKIDTLKRFKDDAKEVSEGYECGLTLEKFNDIQIGDVIEAFVMESVQP
ncbi:translation initiation factor IF-2 [Cohnella algarum]|uniref:translation initiation factor IF-2 n=1 Tax=Cohnella algarum TaxID=2044859 RepID=UPI0019683221|nr:translation initiation factor IF-2 [Cohnella algarum]MBN2984037.1 translation initiation factor IF-2 [Cohnella algarum]